MRKKILSTEEGYAAVKAAIDHQFLQDAIHAYSSQVCSINIVIEPDCTGDPTIFYVTFYYGGNN